MNLFVRLLCTWEKEKGRRSKKELSACLTYLWFKDIFTRFFFLLLLMYSTLKNYSVLAPFYFYFLTVKIYFTCSHKFSISFPSIPLTPKKKGSVSWWERQLTEKTLSYKILPSFSIYFHCKFELRTWSTSATYANVIVELKARKIIKELVETMISGWRIYCVMLSLQQIQVLQLSDLRGCVVCRIGIYR